MFYIHQCTCISPQQTFPDVDLTTLHQPVDQKLLVIEPAYADIPSGVLRRMSKSVRIGVGIATGLLKYLPVPSGIIVGTANAGFEDCFRFLEQIIDYNEGLLSPGNFVQSTPNALAAQLGMLSRNKGYNITHVHLGVAFENAMADAGMLINENAGNSYLLGAVDDISSYNYAISMLAGWFKKDPFRTEELYRLDSPGSIAGEGAAMFIVNNNPTGAVAHISAVGTAHTKDELLIAARLETFIATNLEKGEGIDLLISGEDGDNGLLKYYSACEKTVGDDVPVVRFKHMSGEYPTASAMAVWLACYYLEKKSFPQHMIKKGIAGNDCKNILIYNNHRAGQHGFVLIKRPPVL